MRETTGHRILTKFQLGIRRKAMAEPRPVPFEEIQDEIPKVRIDLKGKQRTSKLPRGTVSYIWRS